MWQLCQIKGRGWGLRSKSWRKRWSLWASLQLLSQVTTSLYCRQYKNYKQLNEELLWLYWCRSPLQLHCANHFQSPSPIKVLISIKVAVRLNHSADRVAPSCSLFHLAQVPLSRPPAAPWGSHWVRDTLRCTEVGLVAKLWTFLKLIIILSCCILFSFLTTNSKRLMT